MSDHFIRPDNDIEPTAEDFDELASRYQAGTDKALASGYEEFGPAFQLERKMVIAALREVAQRLRERTTEHDSVVVGEVRNDT